MDVKMSPRLSLFLLKVIMKSLTTINRIAEMIDIAYWRTSE